MQGAVYVHQYYGLSLLHVILLHNMVNLVQGDVKVIHLYIHGYKYSDVYIPFIYAKYFLNYVKIKFLFISM